MGGIGMGGIGRNRQEWGGMGRNEEEWGGMGMSRRDTVVAS